MPISQSNTPPRELYFFGLSPGDVVVEISSSPPDDSSASSLAPPQGDSLPFSLESLAEADRPMSSSPRGSPNDFVNVSEQVALSSPSTPRLQNLAICTPQKPTPSVSANVIPSYPNQGSTPRRRFMRASGSPPSRPRGRSEREEFMRSVEKKTPTQGKRRAGDGATPKASHRRVLFGGGCQQGTSSTSQTQPSTSRNSVSDDEEEEPKKKTPKKIS